MLWIELNEQMIKTTPIFECGRHSDQKPNRSKQEVRAEFLTLMKDTFDAKYIAVLRKIYDLPGSINKEEFLQKLNPQNQELNPLILKSVQGYRALWHVY